MTAVRVACRRDLDHERETGRHRRSQAEPYDKPQRRQDHPGTLRYQSDRTGADAADESAKDELLFAAPGVSHAAPDHRAADRTHSATVENDRGLSVGEMPLRTEHGQQECHDGEIEELQHRDQRKQAEVEPVARTQPRAVEQRQQGLGRLPAHGRLLSAPCLTSRVRSGQRCLVHSADGPLAGGRHHDADESRQSQMP